MLPLVAQAFPEALGWPAKQRLAFLAEVKQPGQGQGQTTSARDWPRVRGRDCFLDRLWGEPSQLLWSDSAHVQIEDGSGTGMQAVRA